MSDFYFSAYDFQLCQPQSDIKSSFESRELEATFCRDFACCGLVLQDLHDLLQHYEECHVRLEDEEGSFYDDSESGWTSSSSSVASSAPSSPILGDDDAISALKKKAAAYLSDLYNTSSANTAFTLNDSLEETIEETELEPKKAGKKRTYSQFSSPKSALDLLTQSAAKKIALASGDLPTPLLTDEDFLAQAGALLASTNTNMNADKPYKCPVSGCDKAYKNPNGLKYHNQHGHCNMGNEDIDGIASKPYQCTIGDCGKRYKNLNGLKYHIEHSHMAALNHTLAAFGSSMFANSLSQFDTSADEGIIPSSTSLSSLY